MSSSNLIEIEVNGKIMTVPASSTIKNVTELLNAHGPNVIAELDGNIIKNKDFDKTTLFHGVKLELIKFVGGG